MNLKKIKSKNIHLSEELILKVFTVLFLLIIIVFPKPSIKGATLGLLAWFNKVLPTLLPFIIISNLAIALKITRKISPIFYPFIKKFLPISSGGTYPLLIGLISGLPMGAKVAADSVINKEISQEEGQFLLSISNNISPMFIMNFIAINSLNIPKLRVPLLLILYSSAIISSYIFYRIYSSGDQTHKLGTVGALNQSQTLVDHTHRGFSLLDKSIMNGFETITKVGGYIILFSILGEILFEITAGIGPVRYLIIGFMEVTIGINKIALSNINENTKIVLATIITAFGGLSGLAQTKSVISETRLSLKRYIFAKALNICISFVLIVLYLYFIN